MFSWRTAPSCYNKRNKHGDIKSVNSFPPRQRKYTTFPPLTNWNIIISKHFETNHGSAIWWVHFLGEIFFGNELTRRWVTTIVLSQLIALFLWHCPFCQINLDSISSPLSGDKNISWLFLTNWRKVNKRTASLDRREQKHRPTQYPNTQEVTNLFSDLFLSLFVFSIWAGQSD